MDFNTTKIICSPRCKSYITITIIAEAACIGGLVLMALTWSDLSLVEKVIYLLLYIGVGIDRIMTYLNEKVECYQGKILYTNYKQADALMYYIDQWIIEKDIILKK